MLFSLIITFEAACRAKGAAFSAFASSRGAFRIDLPAYKIDLSSVVHLHVHAAQERTRWADGSTGRSRLVGAFGLFTTIHVQA